MELQSFMSKRCNSVCMMLICFAVVFPASLLAMGNSAGTITFDHDCFTINGEDVAIYSGSVHYFRVPQEQWKDVLTKTKAAGFNTVQTVIPWNYHERVKNQFDFSELEDFVKLCAELGLYVIARPGEFICAEWDNGGFPDWLIDEGVAKSSLRTNEYPYIKWVEHWYDNVMPIIKKHLITNGGNIILVQVENEFGGGAYYKRNVLKDRYKRARALGIDVPIVACNTPYAWDNSDPVMADIINGNNSKVVRWENIDYAEKRASQARREEINGPTIVLENPAGQGMYSNMVGYAEPTSLDDRDYTAVNKTLWMEGVSVANYYMLYGGTNFAYWGASYMSTSYASREPVSCPMAEGGGLLDSYYAVKLIGQWLNQFGAEEVRSRVVEGGASIVKASGTKKAPKIVQKVNGDQAFIFIREQEDKTQQYSFVYTDPRSKGEITVPSKNQITLPARHMAILNCNAQIGDAVMQYSTSEIIGMGKNLGKNVVLVYGAADSFGQARFILDKKPIVVGTDDYKWFGNSKTLEINYTHCADDKYIAFGDVVYIVTTFKRAYTSWFAQAADGVQLPIVSNCYFVGDVTASQKSIELEVQSLPQTTFLTTFSKEPRSVELDGSAIEHQFDSKTGKLSCRFETEACPFEGITFEIASFAKEDFSAGADWIDAEFAPLEEQGIFDKGYIRYSADFDDSEAESMIVRYYEGSAKGNWSRQTVGDPAMVFINGKYVSKPSGWHQRKVQFDVKEYLKAGNNHIDVILEKIGRPCGAGGYGMSEAKGLAAVSLAGGLETNRPWLKVLKDWKINVGLNGQDEGFAATDFDDSCWQDVKLGNWKENVKGLDSYDGIAWYRLNFDMNLSEDWYIPLYLSLDVSTDAIIYVNGHHAGRYNNVGWQREFYLPDAWLNKTGKNVIAVVVRNSGKEAGLNAASVKAYDQFAVQKHKLKVNYKKY
jgi:hypothetical protein